MTDTPTARERPVRRGPPPQDRPPQDRPRGRVRPRPERSEAPGPISAAEAAEAGLRELSRLTGKHVEAVTAVQPAEEGWLVGAEILEDRRVPSSADMLALYEAELDGAGILVSYRRVRRYSRGRAEGGGLA